MLKAIKHFNSRGLVNSLALMMLLSTVACVDTKIEAIDISDEDRFIIWQSDIRKKAIAANISPAIFDQAFKAVEYKSVYKSEDTKQFTRQETFAEYYDKHVNYLRIRHARSYQKKLADELLKTEEKFGVPQGYILALWGVETDYGNHTGNFYVIESLANLAYNTRRKEFFEQELIFALKMINDSQIEIKDFKGSWAGANGQCQFMPSSYYKYAYDGDNDGRKDIWENDIDIMSSIANYLHTLKWNNSVPWGYEIEANEEILALLESQDKIKLLSTLVKSGVKRIDNETFTENELQEKVRLLKLDNRMFITFNNFDILRDWNRSSYFAATIGIFAEQI